MKKYFILSFIAVALFACKPAQEEKKAETIDFDKRLKELNITLSAPSAPMANYVKTVRAGNLVFTLGADLTLEQGQEAARLTGIALLSSLKAEIGDLGKVKRIVKVLGMVQSVPEFKDQPKVINAFSDMMVAVFGEKGKHARSAVGMNALPAGMAVEIEMVVEVEQ
jgi:enamine deaminase RidA (YjgF/YER057c/UK114 family)